MANLKDLIVNGSARILGDLYASNLYKPPLLTYMYSDHLLNDIQWLRSDTFSWHSGAVYVSAYNELVSEYNNTSSTTENIDGITCKKTPKGYYIAASTVVSNIDNNFKSNKNAWFFILDTTNKRFKLPRCLHGELIEAGGDMIQGYRIYEDGYCEQWGKYTNSSTGWIAVQITFQKPFRDNNYIINTGQQHRNYQINTYEHITFYDLQMTGFKLNPYSYPDGAQFWTAEGYVETGKRKDKEYLYFYVGEFAQESIKQTAGITSEALNAKVDESSLVEGNIVITTYGTASSGYRIWSNGYCEQWGIRNSSTDGMVAITFAKSFSDKPVILTNREYSTYTGDLGTGGLDRRNHGIIEVSKTGFNAWGMWGSQPYLHWRAFGFLPTDSY